MNLKNMKMSHFLSFRPSYWVLNKNESKRTLPPNPHLSWLHPIWINYNLMLLNFRRISNLLEGVISWLELALRNSQGPSYINKRVRHLYVKVGIVSSSVLEKDAWGVRPSVNFKDFSFKKRFLWRRQMFLCG